MDWTDYEVTSIQCRPLVVLISAHHAINYIHIYYVPVQFYKPRKSVACRYVYMYMYTIIQSISGCLSRECKTQKLKLTNRMHACMPYHYITGYGEVDWSAQLLVLWGEQLEMDHACRKRNGPVSVQCRVYTYSTQ